MANKKTISAEASQPMTHQERMRGFYTELHHLMEKYGVVRFMPIYAKQRIVTDQDGNRELVQSVSGFEAAFSQDWKASTPDELAPDAESA